MVHLGPLDDTHIISNECDFINKWHNAYCDEKKFETLINLRILYIVNKIIEIYNLNKKCTNFSSFSIEEQVGDDKYCYECGGPEVNLHNYFYWKTTDSSEKYIHCLILNVSDFPGMHNDKFINLAKTFPKKWLFSDFEEELKSIKQAYIDFNIKRDAEKLKKKQDKLNSKNDKIRLKEQLKEKLTPEELALISFKK